MCSVLKLTHFHGHSEYGTSSASPSRVNSSITIRTRNRVPMYVVKESWVTARSARQCGTHIRHQKRCVTQRRKWTCCFQRIRMTKRREKRNNKEFGCRLGCSE